MLMNGKYCIDFLNCAFYRTFVVNLTEKMKQLLNIFLIFSLILIYSGCGKTARSLKDFKDLDLTEKGIPLTVKVPSGTEISEDTAKRVLNLVEKGIVLKGKNYHVRAEKILKEYQHPRLNIQEIKDARLTLEKKISHKGEFNDVVLEEPNGFIFTTKIAPHGKTYHFFYVTVANGQQIEFTDYFSVIEKNTEEDIKLMYESVKQGE